MAAAAEAEATEAAEAWSVKLEKKNSEICAADDDDHGFLPFLHTDRKQPPRPKENREGGGGKSQVTLFF